MNDIHSLVRMCQVSGIPDDKPNESFNEYLLSSPSRLEVYVMFISYGLSYLFLYGR